MILKICTKKDEWLYISTTKFKIHQTYDKNEMPPEPLNCYGMDYQETKHHPLIKIVNIITNSEPSEKEQAHLLTYISTDEVEIEYIGDFFGFVLNDKGQTVERL